jgi:type IV pilus assembly protein PilA
MGQLLKPTTPRPDGLNEKRNNAGRGSARMARTPPEKNVSESGFSLVELLVVMLILGLLAAIAIPAFFGERDKARDAAAKSAARTAATAAETIATDNEGAYDGPRGVSVANLIAVEQTLADTAIAVPSVTENGFTVRITSETGNTFDYVRNDDGTNTLTCATADRAGCPPDGTWD